MKLTPRDAAAARAYRTLAKFIYFKRKAMPPLNAPMRGIICAAAFSQTRQTAISNATYQTSF